MELATGMHYWNGTQWTPSVPSFQATDNGFAAAQAQHKVALSSNIFVTGAVNMTTPDGIALQSTPLGIGLYDAASGNFLLIGQITNSIGIQVASNQVVYPNAFDGVCANLVYTMNRGSFQQDVVFTGNVDPTAYGFPTNTTRIQVVTEFYGSPTPQVRQAVLQAQTNQTIRSQMASPDLVDQTLSFGKFFLGHGRAFLTGTNVLGNPNALPGAPVGKAFNTVDQRQLLVESVEYKSVAKALQSLPECNPNGTASNARIQKAKTAYAALPVPPKMTRNAAAASKATTAKAAIARKRHEPPTPQQLPTSPGGEGLGEGEHPSQFPTAVASSRMH